MKDPTKPTKLRAVITRQNQGPEFIHGIMLDETTTHYLLFREATKMESAVKEWFAKSSRAVTCEIV